MALANSQKRLLELFRNNEDPVLTTSDVAEEFDITSQAAHQRLDLLHEEGEIKKRSVGAAAVVYWLPED